MNAKKMYIASAALAGVMLVVVPAIAACGGNDQNGCSVSPTRQSCARDLAGDQAELQCNLLKLVRDLVSGRNRQVRSDILAIKISIAEIRYDTLVLASLRNDRGRGGRGGR